MKRQIIKTRPVSSYRIARIVIAVAIVALLAACAYLVLWPRTRPVHAGLAPGTTVRQDLPIFSRNAQSPAILT